MMANKHWIFLRGLTRDSRHWGRFPALFRARLPATDVVTLDLPGNGPLNQAVSSTDVQGMVSFCRAELAARGVTPPHHLLGLSLGAMLAVAWAAEYPEEISACVLINTSLRPINPFWWRLRLQNIPRLLTLALRGGSAAQWEETILTLTSARPGTDAEVLDDWIAWRNTHPVSHANTLRQVLAAARFNASWQRPSPPMLILSGAGDRLVDPRCSRQLAKRWQITHVQHSWAGHDLPLDDGPWVVEQIARWL